MRNKVKITQVRLLVSASLKGFSQVMLMENAISGSLILLGISLHSPSLALVAFLSSGIGTCIGMSMVGERDVAKKGIYGFNSLLSGMAIMLFIKGDWRLGMALIAAVFSAYLMYIVSEKVFRGRIPSLTTPFILTIWLGLLVSYKITNLHINPAFVTSSPAKWQLPLEGKPNFFLGLIKGVGEVFIIDSTWAGSLILIALFVTGWRFGIYAIIGTIVSWLTALSLGVDVEALDLGLYNYNAVLTIIAVGLLFDEKRNYLLIGIFAAATTVPITAGLDQILSPIGLPILTSPFIISSWLFLAIRKAVLKSCM